MSDDGLIQQWQAQVEHHKRWAQEMRALSRSTDMPTTCYVFSAEDVFHLQTLMLRLESAMDDADERRVWRDRLDAMMTEAVIVERQGDAYYAKRD
jgi:hypothetical protein